MLNKKSGDGIGGTRTEADSMGIVEVPDWALYGPQTARALQNFRISNRSLQSEFVMAQAMVKKACALANMDSGALDPRTGDAIVSSCDEILGGKHLEQFSVDVYQAGAGTSQNMNMNEVLARLASEKTGSIVSANDHANLNQSTNDTFPTSMQLAAYLSYVQRLRPAVTGLAQSLRKFSREHEKTKKAGRTHLQDAVPMTLGEEFAAHASATERAIASLDFHSEGLLQVCLGGNAVGNGINTPEDFDKACAGRLAEVAGVNVIPAPDPVEVTANPGAVLLFSASVSALAAALARMASDIILLSSGPRTGLFELSLPPLQPGSSFMPGKVNPVQMEMLRMACIQARGHAYAIQAAGEHGALQLNVNMPMMAWSLLDALDILANASASADEKCIRAMKANEEVCARYAGQTMGLATLLIPRYGYLESARLASMAQREGAALETILIREKGLDPASAREMLKK